jgi:peptidoglycan/xylan/chitin deacetylase (PgdA/CDA1 family)
VLTPSLKRLASNCIGKVIDLDQILIKRRGRYVLALHRILPLEIVQAEYVQPTLWTSPETFERQIQWMLKIGNVVDMERILDFEKENDKPLFSITFDDGWKDNYTYAFPLLKKYGITATIFVVTSAVDTGRLLWPEEVINKTSTALTKNKKQSIINYLKIKLENSIGFRFREDAYGLVDCYLEYLKELSLSDRERCIDSYYREIGVDSDPIIGMNLNWEEILQMDRYGIHFGSHTHTHAILQYCDRETSVRELVTSKRILEERLAKPIDMFCYPNARYKDTDAHLLEETGYRYGFRLHNLPLNKDQSMYFIPRIMINERTCLNPNYFKFRLLGIPKY